MSLGQEPHDLRADVAVARLAMEAGVWFHSSPTYNKGFTYMILRLAFDEAPAQRPRLILKIRDAEPRILRFEIEDALRRLGVEKIDLIQLVYDAGRPTSVVEDFLAREERWQLVQDFKQQGKIGGAVLFLEKSRPTLARAALEAGLFDGVIFYNNLIEYNLPDSAAEFLHAQPEFPVLALRTVSGGAATSEGSTDPIKAAKRARLQTLAAECGCTDWVELSMRFALAHAGVRTTIGGTKNLRHLERFLSLSKNAKPLPDPVVNAIHELRGPGACNRG
jgi:aryl-alcohol dehydrogenase-like predicted oxidoreductase